MHEFEIIPRSLVIQLVYRWNALPAEIRNKLCPTLADTINEIKQLLQNEVVGINQVRADYRFNEIKAAQYIGCSLSTIQHKRKAGLIEYLRKGRRILYTKESLDRFLELTTIKIPSSRLSKH